MFAKLILTFFAFYGAYSFAIDVWKALRRPGMPGWQDFVCYLVIMVASQLLAVQACMLTVWSDPQ